MKLAMLLLIASLVLVAAAATESEPQGKFYYFAYGSNLLQKRIRIQNPSAIFFSPAQLDEHRLDFSLVVARWAGAVATIVPDHNQTVWGALWTLDLNQVQNLDNQEGVGTGWYFAKNVTVSLPDGSQVTARTYQLVHNPPPVVDEKLRPEDRKPSLTYLAVIIQGAKECGIPTGYIDFIHTFPPNDKFATKNTQDDLGYPFNFKVYEPAKRGTNAADKQLQ